MSFTTNLKSSIQIKNLKNDNRKMLFLSYQQGKLEVKKICMSDKRMQDSNKHQLKQINS